MPSHRPKVRRHAWLLASTLLAAAGCAQPDDMPVATASRCAADLAEAGVRCLAVTVPENRDVPGGRTIALNVVVIPATAPDRSLPPLYDLAGGPGLPATETAAFYLGEGAVHRQHRDIVLVDQRGTGGSSSLACPELGATGATFPEAATRACRDRLAAGADLSAYHTDASVADLQAVRAALGHGEIDLFGLSYGTRLALAWIAAEPAAIRAATLVGTVPDDARIPLWHARNAQDTLDQVFADCRADRACAGVYRTLGEDWAAVLRRADFDGPARETFRNLLTTTPGQRRVPAVIRRIATDGPPDEPPPPTSLADGLFLSVTCAEDTAWIGEDEIDAATAGTFVGDWRVRRQQAACAIWNVPKRTLRYARTPVDVPVLLIAGERDHVTPVAWARRVAAAFPRSRLVTIPALGHFPAGLTGMACLDSLILAFAANPDPDALDTACVATMRPPSFAAPYRRD
jgi:pimeloyl-ACP methyl ester carboxylesterase